MTILYQTFKRHVCMLTLLIAIIFINLTEIHAQEFRLLGTLGGSAVSVYDVSSNGKVVGKSSTATSGNPRAFLWTRESGMQDLGTLGGNSSEAFAISADGKIVVGRAVDSVGYNRAFYWTSSSGMHRIDSDAWRSSEARGISDDGTFIVGYGRNTSFQERAFIWDKTSEIMDLGTADGASNSKAFDVSIDGSVIAVESGTADLWSQTDGWVDVSGVSYFAVQAITPDGRMVVGYSDNLGTYWTEETGLVRFSALGGSGTYAYDVTADGKVIVGSATLSSGEAKAFRWTQETAAEDINEIYAELIPDSLNISSAVAISPNGRYITGSATPIANNSVGYAFLIDTGELNFLSEPEPVQFPQKISLEQNYPNPFNPITNITFSIPKQSLVELVITDMLGKQVATLVQKNLQAGTYEYQFDGSQMASGIYFYMLKTNEKTMIKKMLLVK